MQPKNSGLYSLKGVLGIFQVLFRQCGIVTAEILMLLYC